MIRDYIIKEKLGTGSYGVVYKVTKKTDRNIYVLKQISLFGLSQSQIEEVKNEAKILSQLSSDFVVRYYDSFEEKNFLNIVMEFCDGGDLGGFIDAQKKTGTLLNEDVIWKLFIKTCIGLAYLHKKKILHRDLKALNVFLTKDLETKIGDLGVAKVLTASNFAKTFIGTPYYLSPEICEERPYNEKSDVWALGCILYELCSFKHPFNANSQGALILKIMKGKFDPVSNFYSNDIRKLVDMMLEKNDKVRPSIFDLMKKQFFYSRAKSYGLIQCVIKVYPDIEAVINPVKVVSHNDLEKKMKESGQITMVDLKFNGESNGNNNGHGNSNSNGHAFKGNKVVIKKLERPGTANKSNLLIKGKNVGLSNIINSNSNSSQNDSNINNNHPTKHEGGNGVIQIPQSAKKKYIKITPVKKEEVSLNINNPSDPFSKETEVNKQIEKFNKCFMKNQQMISKKNNIEFVFPMKVENNIDPTPKSQFKFMKKIIIKEDKPKQELNTTNEVKDASTINQTKESVNDFIQELNLNSRKPIKQLKEEESEPKNDLVLHLKEKEDQKEEDKEDTKEIIMKTNSEIDTSKDTLKILKPDQDIVPHKYNNKDNIEEKDSDNEDFAIVTNDNNNKDDDFAVIDNPDIHIIKRCHCFSFDSSSNEDEIESLPDNQTHHAKHKDKNNSNKEECINESNQIAFSDEENDNEEETVQLCETQLAQPSPSQAKNELLERRKTLNSRLNGLKSELSKSIGDEDAQLIYNLYKRTEKVNDKDDEIFADIQKIITEKYSNKEEEFNSIFFPLISYEIQLVNNDKELAKL